MKSRHFLLALAFSVPLLSLAVVAAPKPDGTQRQTAQPWTGEANVFEQADREQTLKLPR